MKKRGSWGTKWVKKMIKMAYAVGKQGNGTATENRMVQSYQKQINLLSTHAELIQNLGLDATVIKRFLNANHVNMKLS